MKLTLSDIYNSWIPLSKLGEKELPIKISYVLGKLVRVVREEVQALEELKMKLFSKYNTSGEFGQIVIPEDKRQEFADEWNELMKKEVELDVQPLPMEIIDEISYINMTPSDMAFLSVFIESDENIN